MSKDTIKAVQTVLDTFGPVMQALPEVLATLTQKDKAERHLKQLQKDCDGLVEQFNAVQAQWEAGEAEHKAKLAALSEAALAEQAKEKEALQKAQAKTREANKKLEAIEARVIAQELAAADRVAAAEAQANEAIAQINAKRAEHEAAVNAEVKAIDKRLEDAQKRLEALKAKL